MEKGKLSLDMLIGLSVFLFTFIFVTNFLPGVFADVRNEINLAHQAYRLSALLVEDPGYPMSWYEDVNLSNCKSKEFRPGLIVMGKEGLNRKEYNHLDLNKTKKFAELMNDADCKAEIKKYLGLDLRVLNSSFFYGFNVSLKNMDDSILLKDSQPLLNHGDSSLGMQVMRFERIVYLDRSLVDNCNLSVGERCVAKLEVRVWI
mgnify:CR=1 FL=1